MSIEYGVILFLKQSLTKSQVQHLYNVTSKYVSDDEFENFLESFNFLLRSLCGFKPFHEKELLKLTKYDKDESWYNDISVWSGKYFKVSSYVLALTWARYIYQEFSICVFGANIGVNDDFLFLYNEQGLIVSKQFQDIILQKHPILGDYRLSIDAQRVFENGLDYSFADLSKIGIIEPLNTTKSEILVVHCYKYPLNLYYDTFRPYQGNYDKFYTVKEPVDNPRLIDFCCIGPVKYTVEHSNWHYTLTDLPTPLITKTYRAEARWRDVILLEIMERQYFYGDAIVTTANGDIVFILQKYKFIINTSWQEYFSQFPLKENYIFDEDIKILDTFQYNK